MPGAYSKDQRVKLVSLKAQYPNENYTQIMQRYNLDTVSANRKMDRAQDVRRIFHKFLATGSVLDLPHSGRPKSATDENLAEGGPRAPTPTSSNADWRLLPDVEPRIPAGLEEFFLQSFPRMPWKKMEAILNNCVESWISKILLIVQLSPLVLNKGVLWVPLSYTWHYILSSLASYFLDWVLFDLLLSLQDYKLYYY